MYQYQAHTIDDNKMLTQVNMGGKQDASLTFGFVHTQIGDSLRIHSAVSRLFCILTHELVKYK